MDFLNSDKQDSTVEIPIDGTLDLHAFSPGEIKSLVTEYIAVCRQKGILSVRIIHGKGTGRLRRFVHAILKKLPEVEDFKLGDLDSGSWGSTLASLAPIGVEPTERKR